MLRQFPRKASKSLPNWASQTVSFPNHTGPLASELLRVLFPLPGMPVLLDPLLFIP